MNHDYSHCLDYNKDCPKDCFRGKLVRDLSYHPMLKNISFMSFKDTEECSLKIKRGEENDRKDY